VCREEVAEPVSLEFHEIEPLGVDLEISRVPADEAPRRRVISVYGADEQLLTSCAADVEIGNLMDLAVAVGAGRRLILEEVEP
jgi:hypothetical protein